MDQKIDVEHVLEEIRTVNGQIIAELTHQLAMQRALNRSLEQQIIILRRDSEIDQKMA